MRQLWAAASALYVMAASAVATAQDSEPRFDNGVRGAVIGASFGTLPVGDSLMGELGGESAGLRSFADRRALFSWDVRLAAKGGYLGNEHPFMLLLGVHAIAWTEYGLRLLNRRAWSPYVGARIGSELGLMGHPGLAGDAFNTVNSVDGVGGVVADGKLRLSAGASLLDRARSLLLVAFAQEELQAAQTNTPSFAFTELGLGARFDLARSVIAEIDGVWGVTPTRSDALHGTQDQTTRLGLTASFRKILGNGMWLGATLLLARDSDALAYAGGQTFDTADPPTIDFELFFGVPLWRTR